MLLPSMPVAAQGTVAPGLTINTFGTLAGNWINADGLVYSHPGAINRFERIRHLSSSDSVLGMQAVAELGASTRATVQAHLAPNHKDLIRPSFAWAYLSHDLTPQLTLRGGRMRAPILMNSDSYRINFGQPWVRQPVEVYGLNPLLSLDGIDLLYRTQRGGINIELQPYWGQGGARFEHSHIRTYDISGLNIGLSTPSLRLHLGHGSSNIALHFADPVALIARDRLEALNLPQYIPLITDPRSRVTYTSAGFEWQLERLRLAGEVVQRTTPNMMPRAFGWHLSAAFDYGALTPFITVARAHAPGTRLPVKGDPILDTYSMSRSFVQKSISAGVRWDVSEHVAYKVQWMHARVPDHAVGSFHPRVGVEHVRASNRHINTLTLSVDFFF